MAYMNKHPRLQETSSPFPGGNIPISRKHHPRFQEETSPFPGNHQRKHPHFQEKSIMVCFINLYMQNILFNSEETSPFPGGNIPVSRMGCNQLLYKCFLAVRSVARKSNIPVSRIAGQNLPIRGCSRKCRLM